MVYRVARCPGSRLNGIKLKPSDFVQGSPDSMTQFYNYAPYINLIPREQTDWEFYEDQV